MKTTTRTLVLLRVMIAAAFVLPGCGGDPASPQPAGIIEVVVQPATLAASWILNGPDGFNHAGVGNERLSDLKAGEYVLTWGTVADWFRPEPAVVDIALPAGGEQQLVGTYSEGASLVIEPQPVGLDAPWSLSGPDGWSFSGTGQTVVEDLAAGTYALTWEELSGYDTPAPSVVTHDLAEGEIVVLRGEYGTRLGRLRITPTPADVPSAWTVTSSDGTSVWSGDGPVEFLNVEPGTYTVAWAPTPGWLTPEPITVDVPSDGDVEQHFFFTITAVRVVIPAGTFLMGNPSASEPDTEPGAEPDEFPRHQVTLSRPFQMGVTEVTNAQFLAVVQWAYDQGLADSNGLSLWEIETSNAEVLNMDDPRCEIGFAGGEFFLVDAGWGLQPDHPVSLLSWYGAARFCDWMNDIEGRPRSYGTDWLCNGNDPYGAAGYRMPTEAEWEYACRSGLEIQAFFTGPITNINCADPNLDGIGWYCGNSEIRPHPVAQLQASPWGLYDMHGNLFEWVNDVSTPRYSSATVTDPVVTEDGANRTTRGGTSAFFDLSKALNCRAANRSTAAATQGRHYIGLRVVRTLPDGAR